MSIQHPDLTRNCCSGRRRKRRRPYPTDLNHAAFFIMEGETFAGGCSLRCVSRIGGDDTGADIGS
jgi:hypothetical protein